LALTRRDEGAILRVGRVNVSHRLFPEKKEGRL
jgi:hypothetical protein